MNKIDHTAGQIGLRQEFTELHRVMRCLLTRLNHYGVAGHQGRGCLPGDQKERKIPRENPCNYPDRLPEEKDTLVRAITLQNFSFDTTCPLRHVVEIISSESHLHSCKRQNLTLFLHNDTGNGFGVLPYALGNRAQYLRPLDGRKLSPSLLCSLRSRNCSFNVGFRAVRYRANRATGRRVADLDTITAG